MGSIKAFCVDHKVIYYPELAPFLRGVAEVPTAAQMSERVREQVAKIKILCLAFDRVFIPPAHLVATLLGQKVGENRDFLELVAAEAIITSYWHTATDYVDFLDQLEEYQAEIGCPISYPESAKATFAILTSYARDVSGQTTWFGQQLVDALQENKVTICNLYGEKAFNRVLDIVRRSEYRDVMLCSHESLLMRLHQDESLPEELKRDVQRLSCFLYYEGGTIGNACLRYPVAEIEPGSLATLKFAHVYAAFFAPVFVQALLNALGIPRQLAFRVGDLHSRDIVALRGNPASAAFWDIYYSTLVQISQLVDETLDHRAAYELVSAIDVGRALDLMRDSLVSGRSSVTRTLISDLALVFLKVVGLMTGAPLLELIARRRGLNEWLEELVLRFRHPACLAYRDDLRGRLREAFPHLL